jgi:HEAT repeats
MEKRMNEKEINALVGKYNEGVADPSELNAIEQLIESGEVDMARLTDLKLVEAEIFKMEAGTPSLRLDDIFHESLSQEKKKIASKSFSFQLPEWNVLFPRLALAASLLIAGFVGGYFLQRPSQDKSVTQLTEQVGELKEMMMLSMLEKESATERLKAVSLTSDMNQVSKKVTSALFKTLNGDENVNVRLAALDVLMNYAKDGDVRAELIKSISVQDSPLVQIALAELMVTLQEKKSVTELKKLLQSKDTPKEVRGKIEKSISVLI